MRRRLFSSLSFGCLGIIASCTSLMLPSSSALSADQQADTAPGPAKVVGFVTNTFSTNAFDTSNVDISGSRTSGFKWYIANFFHGDDYRGSLNGVKVNDDKSLSISSQAGISTTVKVGGAPPFRGMGFGQGGYFEAEVAFDPNGSPTANGGTWPGWWAMSTEHMTQQTDKTTWSGQTDGFEHFVEVDAFEYDRDRVRHREQYGATIHDWYGQFKRTCVSGYCEVSTPFSKSTASAPVGTDWTKFHKIAFMWKPATASARGEISFYFDRKLVSTTYYSRFNNQSPPVSLASDWAFGVIDKQHLTLMLSSPRGWPMTVKSVNVWQKSTAGNIVN